MNHRLNSIVVVFLIIAKTVVAVIVFMYLFTPTFSKLNQNNLTRYLESPYLKQGKVIKQGNQSGWYLIIPPRTAKLISPWERAESGMAGTLMPRPRIDNNLTKKRKYYLSF